MELEKKVNQMMNKISNAIITVISLLLLSGAAWSQNHGASVGLLPSAEDADNVVHKPSYSPYAGRNFPTNVYFGDTHLHTDNSLDAKGFGAIVGVKEAYRLAVGEEVVSNTGIAIKLSRPLDFLVVADHSDGMGAMKEIFKGNPNLMTDPTVRDWNKRMNAGGEEAFLATMDVINSFTQGKIPAVVLDREFQKTIWDEYIDLAEAFNEPGRFTAMIGYEWTSTENGNNLHRNVLYRDDGDVARQIVPYTTAESFNPEDLWKWMQQYEDKTGGSVLTLAHNGNMSNGIMFPVERNPATGKKLGADYMKARIRWEPLYEVTQIKGDGETHPYLSPDDEFADFETLALGNLNLTAVKTDDMYQREYARQALRNGLQLEKKFGTNPYKFGMVGSTDAHTGLAAVEENNYFGKHAGTEPSPERWNHPMAKMGDKVYEGYAMSASGYAGVWATENTREALWDAMMRKEVYATTGPRMLVRFFGGWDFEAADAVSRLPAAAGYSKGVPMGGDLSAAPAGRSPTFLVAALKDAMSGNLDRIQIVKGWMDSSGDTHEKVYNVVWGDADNRSLDANGKLPAVGNTVNVATATWTNTIGDPGLISVWTDPDFDPKESAFYYARVMEIPTPRWTAYDAKRFNLGELPSNVLMQLQERAYTSPIWYTP
jgi:hypothetical protein